MVTLYNTERSICCTYINYIFVGQRLVWLVVFCVFEKYFVHVCWRILIQFIGRTEDYQSDFAITQHAEFVSFFHYAKLPFVESHLKKQSNCQKINASGEIHLKSNHQCCHLQIKSRFGNTGKIMKFDRFVTWFLDFL